MQTSGEVYNQKQPPEAFLKISHNSQKDTCARVSFKWSCRLRPATLSKKRLSHRCFPVDFAKLLRTPFLQNTSWTLKEIWNREPVTKILTNLGVLIFLDLKCSSHITRFVCDRGRSVRFPSTDAVMRKTLKKIRPRIINYRSLKHFSNETKIFLKTLSKEVYVNNDDGLEKFWETTVDK